MSDKKYKLREDHPWSYKIGSDINAQIIGTTLEELFPSGNITPESFVSAASNPTSPLHSFLEWNNDEAAHKYRLYQAGKF